MTLRAECLRNVEALAGLEPEWKALVDRTANPFLSWEWASAWWECFGKGAEPRIVCVRDADTGCLLGIAPLVLRIRPGRRVPVLRELSLLGSGAGGADHLDFPACSHSTEPVRELLVEAVGSISRDVLRIEGAAADAVAVQRAIEAPPGPVWVLERPCPYVSLPRSWEEFLRGLDGKLRYNLQSRARRLERDVAQRVVHTRVREPSELDPALEALFVLHGKVRALRGERGCFADERARAFHRRVARSFLERGWLRLHLLRVGERAVAASYCFRLGDRVFFFQTGYEPDLSRYGLGTAIVAHSIREAIAEGAREFDFLRGDEAYKLQFTRSVRRDLRAWIPVTSRGRAALAGYRFGREVRNRWRALRAKHA